MEEAAAFAAAYTIIIEVFIHREISLTKGLPRVLVKSGILVGAVLILMASSLALSSYCAMEGDLPTVLLEWTKEHIDSKLMFLLCLNILLLILGCILEIFSALVILPPILAPIALQYGVDPVHLGIIFLANLELGFLTPPVGLNLFFSAIRFDQPVTRLYRVIVPYLVIMLFCVLVITYVPALSIGFLEWFK
jgi:tripartite ATP-independent transporter DctM subunit